MSIEELGDTVDTVDFVDIIEAHEKNLDYLTTCFSELDQALVKKFEDIENRLKVLEKAINTHKNDLDAHKN